MKEVWAYLVMASSRAEKYIQQQIYVWEAKRKEHSLTATLWSWKLK